MIISINTEISQRFYKVYSKEPSLKPFLISSDLSFIYPIQVTELRFQTDHVSTKKTQLFEAYKGDPDSAHTETTLFTKLFERREFQMVSVGNKITEIKYIQNDKT